MVDRTPERMHTMTDPRAELLNLIAQLHMMSHVSAANLEPSSPGASESRGGKCPPGGIDGKGDRTPEFRQKSAEHFSARARGCKTERDYAAVLEDARAALDAWKRTPPAADPEWGSLAWRRLIVADIETGTRDLEQVMRHYSISRATVYRYLAAYGTETAA